MNAHRLGFLIRKEFIQLFRNPITLRMILVIPVVQTILFGYVTTTDIKQLRLVVCDRDRSALSRELAARLTNTGYFTLAAAVDDERDIDRYLDRGQAKVAVVFPRRMSATITAGGTAPVQVITDGTNSSEASIGSSYVQRVLGSASLAIVRRQLRQQGDIRSPALDTRTRVWFNPELRSVYYMIPGLICVVLFQITSMLTALGIVREKEQGTMEQIVVTPLRPMELVVGKTLPYALVALVEVVLVMLLGTLWFGVAVKGSIAWVFLSSVVFVFTVLGIGMFVSTLAHTQAQAMMTNQFFMAVNLMLSGYIFPISSMPAAMQYFTYLVPLRYFLIIIRGIFLKGAGPEVWWPELLMLGVFGMGLFTFSAMRFRKRLD